MCNAYQSKTGYLIKLTKMVELRGNILSDQRFDSVIIEAVYEYIRFNMDLNELVIGRITDFPVRNNKPFVQVQVGPCFVEINSSLLSDDSYRYIPEKTHFFSSATKKAVSVGDIVRLKIVQKTERIHKKSGRILPNYAGSLRGILLGKV
jgi:DNA-directed RNA polymerase subunit E'/Rpb7